jgi:hypothetical protein
LNPKTKLAEMARCAGTVIQLENLLSAHHYRVTALAE